MSGKAMLSDLRTYLTADAALVALVEGRIYYAVAPEDAALPYVVYHRVGGSDAHTHDGVRASTARLQFDVVARDALGAEEVGDVLDARLDSPDQPCTLGATRFEFIHREGPGVSRHEDRADEVGGGGLYRQTVDYQISWQAAAPAGFPTE